MANKFNEKLKKAKYLIEWFMVSRCGLQPFFIHGDGTKSEVIFEVCDWRNVNQLAAYGGFARRYPHWSFGMEYEQLRKSSAYGLSKIYEMVINADPCIAYLLEGNALVDQKLVMAHVYGHADFFVNNVYFAGTNRNAANAFPDHGIRIEEMMAQHGEDVVEEWIDRALMLENLIDRHSYAIKRHRDMSFDSQLVATEEEKEPLGRFAAKDYMDRFINPDDVIKKAREEEKERRQKEKDTYERGVIFPAEPERDVLLWLAKNAPLENWQRELLSIIRDESCYYAPQGQTKIMNEGWAAYWHSFAMTSGIADDSEVIDYADHNSGTLAKHPGRINPYLLGRTIFRDIKWRWDSHRHGEIYSQCDDSVVMENWDRFIAYKNALEAKAGDRWREFLCFVRALKDGSSKIPKEIYSERLILQLWHEYQTLDERLRKIEEEVTGYIQKAAKWEDVIRKSRKIKERKYARSRITLLKQFIRFTQRSRKMLMGFNEIRSLYEAGKLKPEDYAVSKNFLVYAARYPGAFVIGDGTRKIFEVRRNYCDVTFIDEFLTREIAEDLEMFSHTYDKDQDAQVIESYDFEIVKQRIVNQLTNGGSPDVRVENADYQHKGELLLRHYSTDMELDRDWARDVLQFSLYEFWGGKKPVYIETRKDDKKFLIGYDGNKFINREIN